MKYIPRLDAGFMPAAVVINNFLEEVKKTNDYNTVVLCLQGKNNITYKYSINTYQDNMGKDDENYEIVERIAKTLVWMVGGYKLYVVGSHVLFERLKNDYSINGKRSFDYDFMSGVYENKFEVIETTLDKLPKEEKNNIKMLNSLKGCRIGFDAGGSDRKVSAVIDGEVVFSDEVVWFPKVNEDPNYHYEGILDSMKTAASYMPRVDAIGVSTAGICIENRLMVSSLYYKVPKDKLDDKAKNVYKEVAKEFGDVPLVVANDGDVTALAGAIELSDDKVLGIAMGTSEAAGYIGNDSSLLGWLNELAFVPVDFNKSSEVDEWSGDYGCGVKYFSQDSVIKLAKLGNIELNENDSPARKLKYIQDLNENGNEVANSIFEDIGIYLGYTIAYYSMFYDIKHILLLGRVVSGKGGNTIIAKAREVLYGEYPNLAHIVFHMPDEKNRRVGQSIAAASLPFVK